MNYLRPYLFLTFGLSIAVSLVVGLTGGHNSPVFNISYITMFIPAVALGVLRLKGAPMPVPVKKNVSWKWVVAALFIFPVIIHAVSLPVMAAYHNGAVPWQAWLMPGSDDLYHTPADKSWGAITKGSLIFHIALNAIAGVLIVSVLAFFEEIGWRAWMLPRLIERYNLKKGIFIGGIICALWHVPYLLSGIHYIPGTPLLTVTLLYTLGQIGVGIILGWLWVRTQSLVIVSLSHGSLNNWGQYAFRYLDDASPGGETVALVAALNVGLLLVSLVILARMKEYKVVAGTAYYL